MIDKLILTGGQNVQPHFYGEEQTIESDDYLLQRDLFELALIREARKQNKPIFGVCRGTQLYNVAMGGSLWGSHLAAQLGNVGIYLFVSIVLAR